MKAQPPEIAAIRESTVPLAAASCRLRTASQAHSLSNDVTIGQHCGTNPAFLDRRRQEEQTSRIDTPRHGMTVCQGMFRVSHSGRWWRVTLLAIITALGVCTVAAWAQSRVHAHEGTGPEHCATCQWAHSVSACSPSHVECSPASSSSTAVPPAITSVSSRSPAACLHVRGPPALSCESLI